MSINERFRSILKLVSFNNNSSILVEFCSEFESLSGILTKVSLDYEVSSVQVLCSEDLVAVTKAKLVDILFLSDNISKKMKQPVSSLESINSEKNESSFLNLSSSSSNELSSSNLFFKSTEDYRTFKFSSHIRLNDVSVLYCFKVDEEYYAFLMHQQLNIEHSADIYKQNSMGTFYPAKNHMNINFGVSLSLLLSIPNSFQHDKSYSLLSENKIESRLPFYVIPPLNIGIEVEDKLFHVRIKKPEFLVTFLVITLLKFVASQLSIESNSNIIKKRAPSSSKNDHSLKGVEILNKLKDWQFDISIEEWNVLIFDDSPCNFSPLLVLKGTSFIKFGNRISKLDLNFEIAPDYNSQYYLEWCISNLEVLCLNGNHDSVLEPACIDLLLLFDATGNQISV